MADSIEIPLGRHAVLFYGPPGSAPDGSKYVDGVVDLTATIEKDDTEVTRRQSGGWEDSRETIRRLRLSWSMPVVVLDYGVYGYNEVTATSDLFNTFLSGVYQGTGDTGIALHAVSNVLTYASGVGHFSVKGWGLLGDFIITRFERAENLADAQIWSCEAKVTQVQGRVPAWTISPV
jgi:hypothetical protein